MTESLHPQTCKMITCDRANQTCFTNEKTEAWATATPRTGSTLTTPDLFTPHHSHKCAKAFLSANSPWEASRWERGAASPGLVEAAQPHPVEAMSGECESGDWAGYRESRAYRLSWSLGETPTIPGSSPVGGASLPSRRSTGPLLTTSSSAAPSASPSSPGL